MSWPGASRRHAIAVVASPPRGSSCLGAHDHALAALGPAAREIDLEIVVAERDLLVGRRQRAEPQRRPPAIGVDEQVASVGEAQRQLAGLVEQSRTTP